MGTITNDGSIVNNGKLDYTDGTIDGMNGIEQYAVLAPLVDHSSTKSIDQTTLEMGYVYKQNSIEVKDGVTYVDVTVEETVAKAHTNSGNLKAYWFGLGFGTVNISKSDSGVYTGWQGLTSNTIFGSVSDKKTSSMTKNGISYDTYYFGMTSQVLNLV